jgi:Tfp pilus assembly protein PilF
MYLGTFYEEIEEFEKAEAALKKGLHNDPENPKIYFRLGVVYDKWGKKESSIVAMKKVIDLDPKNANALNYLGYTYADLGKNLDEAEQLIKEALKYKPDDGYIMDSLGWVYYKKGAFEKALQYLEKATGLVPDDPVILEHLGDIYIKLNDKKKALDFYHRSLLKKKKDKENLEKKIQDLTGEE